MTVHDEVSVAMLRERLGDGPSVLVTPCDPPAMAVYVGAERVELTDYRSQLVPGIDLLWVVDADVKVGAWPHPRGADMHPRIDLVCLRAWLGTVQARALEGVPSPSPCRPATPTGWLPVAEVHLPAFATYVTQANIAEIHP